MFSLKYSIDPTLIYISFGKLLLILPNKLQQPMTIERKANTNVIIKFLQHIKTAIKERKYKYYYYYLDLILKVHYKV